MFVAMQNIVYHLCQFNLIFIMLNEDIRIFYYVQLCLLLIVLIKFDVNFALPNSKVDKDIQGSVSNDPWMKVTMKSGKDKLNAQLLKNTRGNIMKSVLIISGGVFILFIVGGLISIAVYYLKKK